MADPVVCTVIGAIASVAIKFMKHQSSFSAAILSDLAILCGLGGKNLS